MKHRLHIWVDVDSDTPPDSELAFRMLTQAMQPDSDIIVNVYCEPVSSSSDFLGWR
jgi:hypothetical protein